METHLLRRSGNLRSGCYRCGRGRGFRSEQAAAGGLDSYEGTSVFYMVRRKSDFKGKRVVIAGGGDSAVDWALSLSDVADRLYVVHRREKFRAAPESAARLKMLEESGKLELVTPYQLKGLEGNGGLLSGVHVQSMDGEGRLLEADILLPFFGLATDLGPISDWGLEVDKHRIKVDPSSCATNLPGIYAIGDIVTYEDKLQYILTGFAESAQAAHAIYHRIHPGEALHFEYSTTKGIPSAA